MNYLYNTGELHGLYDCKDLEVLSNETETLLADGITLRKEALKEVWANDGSYLSFCVTITNYSGTEVQNATFEDEIDRAWATLVEDSVCVNGEKVPYEYIDGRLIVQLGTVSTEPIVVTFDVKRVNQD